MPVTPDRNLSSVGQVRLPLSPDEKRLDDMGSHFRIFFQPPGGITKPFLPERYVNPHEMTFLNHGTSQFRGYPVQHLKFIISLAGPVLFNQPIGMVYQILVMRGYTHIDFMLKHEIEQQEEIVPDLLVPLVGDGFRFDIDSLAQPEVEGDSGVCTSINASRSERVRRI